MNISRKNVTRTAAAVLVATVCGGTLLAFGPGQLPQELATPLDQPLPGQSLPFTPLASASSCVAGGRADQVVLPPGLFATVLAREGAGFPDLPDMNTVNETGQFPGRYLYTTHETGANGAVSVTDLVSGATHVLVRRADWENLDGIVWTPWGTLLVAEEELGSRLKDPTQPDAVGGHVYEIDPQTGVATVRPALGARAHEGMRFDPQGNLYGIGETVPGYIYRFVPDRRGDLSSGQLFALRILTDEGNRTGWAEWVALDRDAVRINAIAEGTAKGATGYWRPEDMETGTSTGDDRRGNHHLYVAVTGENRVLAIDLNPAGARGRAYVSTYVGVGINAPADFAMPDNVALDRRGNLYITENTGGSARRGKTIGDDVWFAPFNPASPRQSLPLQRFLSLTDCDAEPTGVYLSPSGRTLYLNIQHRGGSDPRDLLLGIQRTTAVASTSRGN